MSEITKEGLLEFLEHADDEGGVPEFILGKMAGECPEVFEGTVGEDYIESFVRSWNVLESFIEDEKEALGVEF